MKDDVISRQAATQTALDFIVEYLGGAFDEDFQRKLIERMNALPSAQPNVARDIATIIENEKDMRVMLQPEIIYCEECKHYNAGFECLIEGYGIERNKDWFCADAERREE